MHSWCLHSWACCRSQGGATGEAREGHNHCSDSNQCIHQSLGRWSQDARLSLGVCVCLHLRAGVLCLTQGTNTLWQGWQICQPSVSLNLGLPQSALTWTECHRDVFILQTTSTVLKQIPGWQDEQRATVTKLYICSGHMFCTGLGSWRRLAVKRVPKKWILREISCLPTQPAHISPPQHAFHCKGQVMHGSVLHLLCTVRQNGVKPPNR